jgi:hypothetical protein
MTTKTRVYLSTLTTSLADVYTAPDRFESSVKSILVSNITATPATFRLDYYKNSGATTTTFVKDVEMAGNSIMQIDNFFHLEVKDKLKALSNTASAIVLSILVEESSVNSLGI